MFDAPNSDTPSLEWCRWPFPFSPPWSYWEWPTEFLTRGGALSDTVTSGELSRGTYSTYVTTLLNAAVVASEEKLGIDTVVLDLRELVDAFDALVITSGRSDRQVRAIAQEVERLVDLALGVKPNHVEGLVGGEWVALDYGDAIVHVFDESARDYYDLEHLWSAAPALRPQPTR